MALKTLREIQCSEMHGEDCLWIKRIQSDFILTTIWHICGWSSYTNIKHKRNDECTYALEWDCETSSILHVTLSTQAWQPLRALLPNGLMQSQHKHLVSIFSMSEHERMAATIYKHTLYTFIQAYLVWFTILTTASVTISTEIQWAVK